MYWIVFGALTLVSIAISIGILGLGLWILSDERDNPFREYGVGVTWAKIAGLVVGINVWAFIVLAVLLAAELPLLAFVGAIITILLWFGGIMVLFEKSFGQAFLLTIACWVLRLLLEGGIGFILSALGYSGESPV